MTIYNRPTRGSGKMREGYIARFVRVGNLISVTRPNDMKTTHPEVATQDNIHNHVLGLRRTRPNEVDAGTIRVQHYRGGIGGEIIVSSMSATYGLPVIGSEARRRTAEVFRRSSPGYEVTTDVDLAPNHSSKERR